jgi:peptidoglycan/xylan/chitin deacetylase (PgdA/CDA1 family)
MYYTGADKLLSPLARGDGAILMLHQVLPDPPHSFSPNRILRVTPAFLDQTIRQVIEAGFECLSLDELAQRTPGGKRGRPFVCFTLDDAYRDNLEYALPVFRRYGVPFAVYVPTDYVDGTGELWWLALEQALASLDAVGVVIEGRRRRFSLATPAEKCHAYHEIYWSLRRTDETAARAQVREICAMAGFDAAAPTRSLIMNWDELRRLAADPLVTIGAHTRSHFAVGRLGEDEARREMRESAQRLEQELGRKVRHFSFPFGDDTAAGARDFALAREAGFATAVTTRKGLVHGGVDLHGLPRVSLNGDYQDARYVRVLLSGAPFLFWRMAGRMRGRPVQA